MSQHYTDFYQQDNEYDNSAEPQQDQGFVDLEQINQFQPEFEPRSTTTVTTDLYSAAQTESNRYRDQGDPDEYGPQFLDQ